MFVSFFLFSTETLKQCPQLETVYLMWCFDKQCEYNGFLRGIIGNDLVNSNTDRTETLLDKCGIDIKGMPRVAANILQDLFREHDRIPKLEFKPQTIHDKGHWHLHNCVVGNNLPTSYIYQLAVVTLHLFI